MRNTTGNDKNRQTLRRILRYIRPYWPLVILSLLLSALTVGLTLYVPSSPGGAWIISSGKTRWISPASGRDHRDPDLCGRHRCCPVDHEPHQQ